MPYNTIEERREYHRKWVSKRPEKVKEISARWYKNNIDKAKSNIRKYQAVNPEKVLAASRKWKNKNLEHCNIYRKMLRNTNPLQKCKDGIRTLISSSIRRMNYNKNTKTEQILGCSFVEFKNHIESKFTKGMSWLNHGEWHLDHITPLVTAKTEEELLRLNHYTNFQPLWSTTKVAEKYGEINYLGNLEKSDRILIYNK